jgi:hypothetical protein
MIFHFLFTRAGAAIARQQHVIRLTFAVVSGDGYGAIRHRSAPAFVLSAVPS